MASRRNGQSKGTTKTQSKGTTKTMELIKDAGVQLATLTGRRPEKVLGIQRGDDGWKVSFELLELERIPTSTDLLGCYVVEVDDDGELVGYERSSRYLRGHASGE